MIVRLVADVDGSSTRRSTDPWCAVNDWRPYPLEQDVPIHGCIVHSDHQAVLGASPLPPDAGSVRQGLSPPGADQSDREPETRTEYVQNCEEFVAGLRYIHGEANSRSGRCHCRRLRKWQVNYVEDADLADAVIAKLERDAPLMHDVYNRLRRRYERPQKKPR